MCSHPKTQKWFDTIHMQTIKECVVCGELIELIEGDKTK